MWQFDVLDALKELILLILLLFLNICSKKNVILTSKGGTMLGLVYMNKKTK
jgi:hypothetical protein